MWIAMEEVGSWKNKCFLCASSSQKLFLFHFAVERISDGFLSERRMVLQNLIQHS